MTVKALNEDEANDWRESLSEMSSDQLLDEWKLAQKLCSTPPTADTVEIEVDGRQEIFTAQEYRSGTFFQISQLIRSEMSRRGISVPGAER